MWIILTIILALNSIWLIKLNKDLANRNEYLIRQVKTNSLTNGLVLEPMSDEKIDELKKAWQKLKVRITILHIYCQRVL